MKPPDARRTQHRVTTRVVVTPVAKPRMTRRDKWAKRPSVLRYRAYADALRASLPTIEPGALSLVFILPMPSSWSLRKREEMAGSPHTSRPDIDNLIKGVLDTLFEDDAGVWSVSAVKLWGNAGRVEIETVTG